MPDQKTVKDEVLKYLLRNKIMSLATCINNMPWSSTVFYAFDDNLNIIFYSTPDRLHCQHIEENPHVSLAINQEYERNGEIRGVQMAGKARMLEGAEKEKYYKVYEKRYSWAKEFPDHEIYLIEPLELHFIDEKFFGHTNRVKVL